MMQGFLPLPTSITLGGGTMSRVLKHSLWLLACVLMTFAAYASGQTTSEPPASSGQTSAPLSLSDAAAKAEHRKLFPQYHTKMDILHETQSGRDIDISVDVSVLLGEGPEEASLPTYPDPYLRGLACGADAIVVASPSASETDITDGGDFLYTDSLFRIESIVKALSDSGPSAGSEIIVTRPGGEALINGHKVRTIPHSFPQFQLNQRYLLFLRYLPGTKTFRAWGSGTFVLSPDGRVATIDPTDRLDIPSARQEDIFLTEVRAASTSPCAGITRTLERTE